MLCDFPASAIPFFTAYFTICVSLSLKLLLDLLRLRHGHLFAVNFVELLELPHRPIPVEHRLLLLLQLPWRPVSERGCSDELQGVSRGEWSSFAILP
jgi:hypothetical protein